MPPLNTLLTRVNANPRHNAPRNETRKSALPPSTELAQHVATIKPAICEEYEKIIQARPHNVIFINSAERLILPKDGDVVLQFAPSAPAQISDQKFVTPRTERVHYFTSLSQATTQSNKFNHVAAMADILLLHQKLPSNVRFILVGFDLEVYTCLCYQRPVTHGPLEDFAAYYYNNTKFPDSPHNLPEWAQHEEIRNTIYLPLYRELIPLRYVLLIDANMASLRIDEKINKPDTQLYSILFSQKLLQNPNTYTFNLPTIIDTPEALHTRMLYEALKLHDLLPHNVAFLIVSSAHFSWELTARLQLLGRQTKPLSPKQAKDFLFSLMCRQRFNDTKF